MRAPAFGAPARDLYLAALEQCAMADAAGFDTVYLAEHHGADDGYCPSPIVLASAIAGRTSRLLLHFSALIATLHEPLRLAEDLAVLDVVSDGRVEITLGIGYRPHEFDLFGVDMRQRIQRLEDVMDVLELAWSGQPFDYRGTTVTVLPRPVQRPRPPLYIGGSTEASARRAARRGDTFAPPTPGLWPVYVAERERLALPVPPPPRRRGPLFLHVTADPARDWEVVAPHVTYTSNSNAEWAKERGVGATPYPPVHTVADLQAHPQQFAVVTPAECVALAERVGADGELSLQPLMGGLDPAVGTGSVALFVSDVLPELEARGLWRRPAPGERAAPFGPAPVPA
jgi:alkanesulfonate monooxygenase SsuD/methylene tetrahydromethanopterin reductase-like flavin-dependent oxidoreductase (luciferase family)